MGREQALVADARKAARTLCPPEGLGQALADFERVERGRGGEIVDDEARIERSDWRRRAAWADHRATLGRRDD